MLSDKLLEYTKGKAEEKYPEDLMYINNPSGMYDKNYVARQAYASGCKDTLELMMGFRKWANDIQYGDASVPDWRLNNPPTESELLTKYIESINK